MNDQRTLTGEKTNITKDGPIMLSEILYALRISKKKGGKSPFENQLGREPNRVKSNAVSKFLVISEQDNSLEFCPTDFQGDLDSTVFLRERSRGSRLKGHLSEKRDVSLKIRSTPSQFRPRHQRRKRCIQTRHRKTVKRTEENHRRPEKKRVVLNTSSNDEEQIKKSNTRKKANQKPQELEFDLEEEQRPEIIDIAAQMGLMT